MTAKEVNDTWKTNEMKSCYDHKESIINFEEVIRSNINNPCPITEFSKPIELDLKMM
ncbi:unnamed protein product [Linum tenue]|uniref:Uncharacterized protein n=1 Tax=Linum tenue TaxID=586396 RepID=A0AAV0MPG7_9ROSI|nr:unnamed protein product [Linum tenue]